MNALYSEKQKNLQSDCHRLAQLHNSSVNPDHPYHKFCMGSKETLNKEDSREVLCFYDQYCSVDIMTVVLIAPLELELLEKYIVELFSGIQNKNIQHPSLILWSEALRGSGTIPDRFRSIF